MAPRPCAMAPRPCAMAPRPCATAVCRVATTARPGTPPVRTCTPPVCKPRHRRAKDHAEGVEENCRWSSASRDTRVVAQLVAARKPPDRRAPRMFHPGGMGDSLSRPRYVSTTPAGVGFSIITVPVVFEPPRFSRGLPSPVRRSTTGHFPGPLRGCSPNPYVPRSPVLDTLFRRTVLSASANSGQRPATSEQRTATSDRRTANKRISE